MTNRTESSLSLETPEQSGSVSGHKVGYARVSSPQQNLARQIEQLEAESVDTYFTDEASGSSRSRPGLEEALRYLRSGDQLVVTSMDRCARSLADLHSIVDELVGKGVSVKFLKEGQVYSQDSTPVATLMLGLLGAVAEFERSIIRDRQAEGIARAKQRGVYKGRAKALTDEQVDQARQWVGEGIPKAEVARRLKIGRTTLYAYLNQEPR
ncbi:recombinase family protein [Corynebacterium tapiri]|uniref:Recombinase family protein n=1 Tax=Corynebacterium tapiri TaxID=1448266 RepID=A0A5C4U129_9CORY|nr:recombinase family protein [Corynebacterium tapiri]TNL94360.1 recombinase family protein [Corynebacterium tapiri]